MGLFKGIPSRSTRVWPASAPRTNIPELSPGEPFWSKVRPGTPCRAFNTVPACFWAMSLEVMTVMELATWETGVSSRLAVTTTSGRERGAWAERVFAEDSKARVVPEGSARGGLAQRKLGKTIKINQRKVVFN